MATVLNLFRLIPSDDQQLFTDKCNFNFDQILNMGGGPPGIQGIQGIQGVPGGQGIQGFQGDPGTPGSKWYVENTDPFSFGPITPAPNEGDFWFDTNTLDIYEYLGSPPMWTLVGNLTVSGVFKDSIGDPDRVIFSSPTPLKSLVLGPINYGVGSPQAGPYKLKLIGSPGSPQQMFGVLEAGVENLASKQSYISVNTISPNVEYSWEVVNPTGNIELSAFGTSLDLIKASGGVSKYEFNSNTFKIQLNATERLESFYAVPSGLNWHVGGHNALSTTSQRLFSINDGGSIGVADAFNNTVVGDTGPYDFRYDQLNIQLPATAASTNRWARWRAKISGANTDQLNIRNVRSFTESSSQPWRTSEIRIEHKTDATYNHFMSMGGGTSTPFAFLSFPNPARPALRFGIGGTANDGYYFAADNGPAVGPAGPPRMWMGTPQFIKDNTGTLFGGLIAAKLNVQSYNVSASFGSAAHTDIHLVPATGAGDYSIHGITAGHNQSPMSSDGGLIFQGWASSPGVRMMSTSLASGDLLSGGLRNVVSAWSNGETYFWSRSDGNAFFQIRSGANYAGTQSNPTNTQMWANDFTAINGYNWSSGAKSIVINENTNYGGFGDGFVGIGDRFSEYITAGPAALTTNKWYKGPWTGAPVHNGIDYQDFVPFQAVNTTLTSGTVVEAKPQTKFQVYGAVTIGSRANILNYTADVGDLSFTLGTRNKATGYRSAVIGGNGNQSNANDSIMIGWSGGAVTNSSFINTVNLVTTTHVSTAGPANYLGSQLYTSGDNSFGGNPYYRLNSAPIMYASTAVPVPQFFITPEQGDMARVLVLEGRNTGTNFFGGPNTTLAGIQVMMEFAVKNGAGTQRQIGAVSGMYYEVGGSNPTNQRGRISINVNSGGNMYEMLHFSSSGMNFIGQYFKPKISVETNKVPGGAGVMLAVTAGSANGAAGAAVGGHLFLDAGAGANTGTDGFVAIGANGTTSGVNITGKTQVVIGSYSSAALVQVGNGNGTDTVRVIGSMQAVNGAFANPGPIASSFVGYSNTIGGGGNFATIAVTQVSSGDTLTVTMSRTGAGPLGGGTTTIGPGQQLYNLEIAAVPYDRTIVAWGGGNAGGSTLWEFRLNGVGGVIYRRQHGDIYSGCEFLVPANNKVSVRLETQNPGYGVAGVSQSGITTFAWTFRAFKHGI